MMQYSFVRVQKEPALSELSPVCQAFCEHTDTIARVRSQQPVEEDVRALADTFKILGDVTRIRIMQALAVNELCVCDLVVILDISQSAISHQLRHLRAAKLVRYRKEGKNVFYALDDDHVRELLTIALEHIQETDE